MERNERLKAADKCASRYTDENEARVARVAFMLGCEFEAQGDVVKGVILESEEQLQQGKHEVDLEEEISRTYYDGSVTDTDDIDHVTYENIARHFYELGRKAKEDKQ